MQLKFISTLVFVSLAAALALPPPPDKGGLVPPPPKTVPPLPTKSPLPPPPKTDPPANIPVPHVADVHHPRGDADLPPPKKDPPPPPKKGTPPPPKTDFPPPKTTDLPPAGTPVPHLTNVDTHPSDEGKVNSNSNPHHRRGDADLPPPKKDLPPPPKKGTPPPPKTDLPPPKTTDLPPASTPVPHLTNVDTHPSDEGKVNFNSNPHHPRGDAGLPPPKKNTPPPPKKALPAPKIHS